MKNNRISKYLRVVFVFSFLLSNSLRGNAQVHIAPTAVYLNNDNTSGQITIHNSSGDPQKISIDLLYGYPDTDEQGNVFLNTFINIPDKEPSAIEFTRIYPRELILPPGEQQIIRLMVRPPSNLQPGEYWVRPAISSSQVRQSDANDNEKITTQFNLIQRTILSLNYRHGGVQTKIDAKDIEVVFNNDGYVSLVTNLQRMGNAAYIGHAFIEVTQNGNLIHEQKRELAVYNDQYRRFNISKKLNPGLYQISFTISTREREAENSSILPANTITKTVSLNI